MANNDFYATSVVGSSLSTRIYKVIDSATRELIDRLLLERISLAGIARAVKVSEQWQKTYVNEKSASVPRQVHVSAKKRGN